MNIEPTPHSVQISLPSTYFIINAFKVITLVTLAFYASKSNAEAEPVLGLEVEQLISDMQRACPEIWQDLKVRIDPETTVNLWADNEADKSDYTDYLQENGELPPEGTPYFSDNNMIAAHCTAAQTLLLSKYYSNLPQQVVAEMATLDYEIGDTFDGFEVGDIRFTLRTTPARGWIFLEGGTVGPEGSGATYAGQEFEALYSIALTLSEQNMNINPAEHVWPTGKPLKLPDMTGRVPVAGTNDQIGTTFGQESITLTQDFLPRHNHNTNGGGGHNHPITAAQDHGHDLYSSIYTGSSSGRSDYLYFEGKARPNYQNVIKGATKLDGGHTHNLTPAPNHTHPITMTGTSNPSLNLSQPSMRFRVEIKYE